MARLDQRQLRLLEVAITDAESTKESPSPAG
jgi:hypothetical protein